MSDDETGAGRPASGAPPDTPDWWPFRGTGEPVDGHRPWPEAPAWRRFTAPAADTPPPAADEDPRSDLRRAVSAALLRSEHIAAVNVGLVLRRPILVTDPTGMVGTGLAHLIARELRLGRVLRWTVNSRSTLRDGTYDYDALGAAHAALRLRAGAVPRERGGFTRSVLDQLPERRPVIPTRDYSHVRLGPLATALIARTRPRVLLIERFDRSGYDLPEDLLAVLEEGRVVVPELARPSPADGPLATATDDPGTWVDLSGDVIQCAEPPVIVITSNGGRAFPAALRQRCVQVEVAGPAREDLEALLRERFGVVAWAAELVERFEKSRGPDSAPAVDQLLDAAHLAAQGLLDADRSRTLDAVWGEAGGALGGFPGELM